MRKLYLCSLAIIIFLEALAAPPRQRLSIDIGWKFSLTDTVGADKAAFDDHSWRMVNLPHDWSIEGDFAQDAATGGGGGYLPTGVGWWVPDAGNFVQLKIDGDGKLMGLDNGNPVDHTSMQSSGRNVFNGLALAILQSGVKGGHLQLSAESPGLAAASLEIETK